MLPFKLIPAYKDYIWGGTRLKTQYGKQTDLAIVAESWELSAHKDGDCIIADGALKGMPFSQFVQIHPELLGARFAGQTEFPILIKFIDAKQALSVQVHPDDAYAQRVECEPGKTEMWIILEAEPDAFLYFGFERETTAEEVRRRIEDDTITEIMHKLPVQNGDVVFIPAGTLHAIGAGILLAEIQENSNSTYRIYDFGRLGADGKPRPLHIEKALDVMNFGPATQTAPGAERACVENGYTLQKLADCQYFSAERLRLHGTYTKSLNGTSFMSVLCAEGRATLVCGGAVLSVNKGDSVFVPCDNASIEFSGDGLFLLTII